MTDAASPAGATRKIEHLPLDDLKADPKNPKAHRLDVLSESVGRFGFVEPVVVDARTGYLVSGHGRAKTLREMRDGGESPPEGIVVDDDGEWLVPSATGWASRTDSEAAAVLIALNRTTEVGGWVDDELLDLLDTLSEEDEDGLLGVGYGDDDLDALRRLVTAYDEEQGPTDPYEEWEAMPDFEQEDRSSAASVTIHFPTQDDADRFFDEVLERDRAKSIWWPHDDGLIGTDVSVEYVADDSEDDEE